jgi:glycosyltransferase involved in cell wall biosynthesis
MPNCRPWPRISIVTPSLGQGQFIEAAIRSVLLQGYPDLEYIVIDGGSPDGTVEVIKKYEKYLAYWVSEPDRGQTHALNKGYARATGDIFGWLNTDEMYLPCILAHVGQIFRQKPNLDVIFGNRIIIDGAGHEIGRDHMPSMPPRLFSLYAYGLLFTDATFWSREIHHRTGVLDEENFPHLSMDFDWMLRLSMQVRHWKHLPGYLSIFRDHEYRKAPDPYKTAKDAWIARSRVIKEQKITKLQLLLGWIIAASYARLQKEGLRGLLWRPRVATILRILGLAP